MATWLFYLYLASCLQGITQSDTGMKIPISKKIHCQRKNRVCLLWHLKEMTKGRKGVYAGNTINVALAALMRVETVKHQNSCTFGSTQCNADDRHCRSAVLRTKRRYYARRMKET